MDQKRIPFNDVAERALAWYGMQGHSLTFIRHSDTAAFKVERPDSGAYLLRIHVPVTAAMGTHGADSIAVASELLWLEALNQDTDLTLQKPVRNSEGALVTQVSTTETGKPVNCTLLQWVDGQPYRRDLESELTAHQIGVLLAKLHRHASQWEAPAGFGRPRRDVAYFNQVLNGLRPALEDGRISSSDYAQLSTSVELLTDIMRQLKETRQTHGIIHADAHKGNMLYHDGAIRLIDFSFCAVGDFMFDLAVCLFDMKKELHAAFLDGYQSQRALPDGHRRLIEGFSIGDIIGTFSIWAANPSTQSELSRVPRIVRDYAARFNRGERFWFS